MKISIIGLGWYGSPLAEKLKSRGFDVSGTTRSEDKVATFRSRDIFAEVLNHPALPSENLLNQDVIILNIPPFEDELSWFKTWKWNPEGWIIFISSTSVYPMPDSKSGELLKAQEEWIKSHFSRWTILRFGGLLGNGRHPGKYLSGKKNLSGRLSPVNLIHQDDCVDFTLTVIENNLTSHTFNVVSDEHPTREEFYTNYCQEKGLPLPEFNPDDHTPGKLVPNDEMKSWYQVFKKLT